jgi:hypothetical protein
MRDDMFVLTETGFEVYTETKSLEKESKIKAGFEGKIESEWFSIDCQGYENYYIQNVAKKEVIERLEKASKKRTVKPMNLVLFMMDTTSRQHFFRKMDEMIQTLEEFNQTGKYETFQFFRIISNGFNTEYNTRAMYSGSQLRQERRGRPYWDFFSGQGNVAAYINGFCEDWMSVFMRTKFKGMDHTVFYPWCHPEFHPFTKTFGNFAGPFSILRRCINGVHVHDYIFDYIHQMWKNYKKFGKIVHVSFQEGHEGTGEVLRTLSPSMAKFFKELDRTGELQDTVVVLTSDHGSHMGPYFMSGDMGKFEQKLPVLFMLLPKRLTDKYPEFREKLHNNEQNLVGHYDTYWTLRHLASLEEFGGEIKENFEQESWHEEVWDCELNLYHMEVVHMFRNKLWRRSLKSNFIEMVERRIATCFKELGVTPRKYENLTTVDYSQLKTSATDDLYYIGDVIRNLDTFYWFEDAYQDVNKNYLKGQKGFENPKERIEKIKEEERKSWDTLKAPGIGRYLFGRSLMKYDDIRTCEEAGIVNCVCSEKSSLHNHFSSIG